MSQYLLQNVIYGDGYDQAAEEVVFRTLLFKIFNKIETWQRLEARLGPLRWADYDRRRYDSILGAAGAAGEKLYSAAYIIPPVRSLAADSVKYRGHLSLLELMMADSLPAKVVGAPSLEAVYEQLKSYPSIGPFLGFQLAIDLNYSAVVDHSENDFVVAGPGALDGLAKCFENADEFAPEELIAYVAGRQAAEFERLGLSFRSLWGRPLQLIDCQNLFCEISKYARMAHPEYVGISGRTRIKQIFSPTPGRLEVWFPPKWGLNATLSKSSDRASDLFGGTASHGLR